MIKITQNLNHSISIMKEVGQWMTDQNLHRNEWWLPKNMNKKFLLQHAEPDEFYVAEVDGIPAASVILQDTERNQSWAVVDQGQPRKALYVHWLCVGRSYAGQGLVKSMIDFAQPEAARRGMPFLRLDTTAEEKKLCVLYENLGFKLMATEKEGNNTAAYYQKSV